MYRLPFIRDILCEVGVFMGLFALCTGYLAEPFRDGENDVSQSKVQHGNNDYSVMNCFAPGIEINPADGEFLVVERLNDSSSFMVSVGGINQNIAPTCERGERKFYSVSEDGESVAASIHLKNDGSIVVENEKATATIDSDGKLVFDLGAKATLKNASQSLATLIGSLVDEISGIQTVGSPTNHLLSPSSIANFTMIKQKFSQLLEA
jgi:hypothetical protein